MHHNFHMVSTTGGSCISFQIHEMAKICMKVVVMKQIPKNNYDCLVSDYLISVQCTHTLKLFIFISYTVPT